MSPYREPAPHVCRYDQWRYVPPHTFVDVCECGRVRPPGLLERALEATLGFVVDVLRGAWP